jgi:arylsulfatase A-like enzyme
MDARIGSYIDILKERNLYDNTLIIFLSDNGAPFPRAKGTLYDSGIKTPLIFNWPGKINRGIEYPHLISVIDLAPTILEICGIDKPEIMEGQSLISVLSDPSVTGRTYVYSERNWHNCDEHMRSIRSDKYKFITNAYIDLPHGTPSDLGASPSWKSLKVLHDQGKLEPVQEMLFTVPRPAEELYDLEKDPYESRNLINDPAYTQVAVELREKLEEWRIQTNDFSPEERRRQDNVDRFTGVKFDQTKLPPRIED